MEAVMVGMAEKVMVGYAEGVLKSSLGKLGSFLWSEALLVGSVRQDIQFIRDELMSMDAVLQDVFRSSHLNQQTKAWILQVLEVACDAELCTEEFLDKVGTRRHRGFAAVLCYYVRSLAVILPRYHIGKTIQALKSRAKEVSERRLRYLTATKDSEINNHAPTDRSNNDRVHRKHLLAEASLVGLHNAETLKICKQVTTDDSIKMLAIVGPAGSGKTMLARMVYRRWSTFDFRNTTTAWITVSRKLDLKHLLVEILKQVMTSPLQQIQKYDEKDLSVELQKELQEKRCLLVLDSLWSVDDWKNIIEVLPPEIVRIVVTTRKEDVAQACCPEHSEMERLRYDMQPLTETQVNELFSELLPNDRLERAYGSTWSAVKGLTIKTCSMPLTLKCLCAIFDRVNMHNYLEEVQQELDGINKNISNEDGVNKNISNEDQDRITKELLDLCWDKHLPSHLRECCKDLSMLPEGYALNKKKLMRKWIANDFVKPGRYMSVEEVAESYFDELISSGIIEPESVHPNGTVRKCLINSTFLELTNRFGGVPMPIGPRPVRWAWKPLNFKFLRIPKKSDCSRSPSDGFRSDGNRNSPLCLDNMSIPGDQSDNQHQMTCSTESNQVPSHEITLNPTENNQVTNIENPNHLNEQLIPNPTTFGIHNTNPSSILNFFKKQLCTLLGLTVMVPHTNQSDNQHQIESPTDNNNQVPSPERTLNPTDNNQVPSPEITSNPTESNQMPSPAITSNPTENNQVTNTENPNNPNEQQIPNPITFGIHNTNPSDTLNFFKNQLLSGKPKLTYLDLEGCNNLSNRSLDKLCEFVKLRFLSLRKTSVNRLPKKIWKLKFLETLDIRQTKIKNVPGGIVALKHLKHLLAGYVYKPEKTTDAVSITCSRAIEVPMEINEMQSLETLAHVNATRASEILQAIRELKQLKKLGLVIREEKLNSRPLCISIMMLSASLRSLSVWDERQEASLDFLEYLCFPPQKLESLNLRGNLGRLPPWVANHSHLTKITLSHTRIGSKDLKLLNGIKRLLSLKLYQESFREQSLVLGEYEFMALRMLVVHCDSIQTIRFKKHASPNLEVFHWVLSGNPTVEIDSIDNNLPMLKDVSLIGKFDQQHLPIKILDILKKHKNYQKMLALNIVFKEIWDSNEWEDYFLAKEGSSKIFSSKLCCFKI